MIECIQQTQPSQRSSNKRRRIVNATYRSNRWTSRKGTMKKTTMLLPTSRWVPKALLQAQNYYEGATQLWLPIIQIINSTQGGGVTASRRAAALQQQSTSSTPTINHLPPTKKSMSMQWRTKPNPKGYQGRKLEEKHPLSQKGKGEHKLTDVTNHSLAKYQTSTSNNVSATRSTSIAINSEGEKPKSMCLQTQHPSYDSKFDYLTIKERALLLQFQLFGISSIQRSFFKYGGTKVKTMLLV